MNLIIFSHSDYSYLWDIIAEHIIPMKDLNPIFVSNVTDKIKPDGFIRYIEYDEKMCYAKRWLSILPCIDEKYILVVHDVQIILNCDIFKIEKLVELLEKNDIDRCTLHVFNGEEIIENENIQICNLKHAVGLTYTPYDLSPTIWKKTSFYKLFSEFPNETYHSSECSKDLQEYCKKNLKCYGLQNTGEKIYYCLGRPFLNIFKVLYITIKGEICFPIEVYMDMKDDLILLINKYRLFNKIPINTNYGFILQYFNNSLPECNLENDILNEKIIIIPPNYSY